ncbi:MAG: putative Sugar transferase, PEP-CTERM/EpsH1 system associated [Gammaproteobacteria bacterium]|nr:putative Sugar transferase, PEP-CTERM/EpsH1 system associated [Gammaproteobacteria bacterium]
MRILLLTHRIPFPPNKGDKIRSFNLLLYLSRRHEVYVASLIDDEQDLVHVRQLRKFVRGFVFEFIGRKLRPLLSTRGVLRRRSISVTYFYSSRLQSRIDALIDSVPFDCLFCSSSPMAEYVFRSRHAAGKLRTALRVMDLIDIDSCKWRQYAHEAAFWKAWVYRLEATHLAEYEQRIARLFDHLFVVTEQERCQFPESTDASRLRALANGVDLEFFTPQSLPVKQMAGTLLVFTGVMDYWPNVEGVIWFVQRILPQIQQSIPGARLYIVGNRPTPEVQKLAGSKGVWVTGYVQDIRDYLAAARVCIAPLRMARGIQNKVLEAMAMGKAVVSTVQAFEGIQAVAGEDIVVAEGEDEFARAVVGLLRDTGRAETIGAHARACMERHYRWDLNLGGLSEIGL